MCEYKPQTAKRFIGIIKKASSCVMETRQPFYELTVDTLKYLFGKLKKGRKSGEEVKI